MKQTYNIQPNEDLKNSIKDVADLRHLKSNLEFEVKLVSDLLERAEQRRIELINKCNNK